MAVPRHLLLRFLVLVAIVVTGFAVLRWTPLAQYLTVERVSALLTKLRESWWAPLALIGSYIVLCPLFVPASPMMIAGGMVFGPVLGSLYNIIGTFLGGSLSYFLGRVLGHDFVRHLLGNRLKRVERMIARRGFWSLVGVRFLPIPYPLVNYTAALAGIRPALFLTTTAIGLIPGSTVFTYFASLDPPRGERRPLRPPRPVRRRLREPAPAHLHSADLDPAETAGAVPGALRAAPWTRQPPP